MTRVCLDTVVTSGRVLEDLVRFPDQMAANRQMTRLHLEGKIKLVTTEVSRIEEARISDPAKRAVVEAGSRELSVVQPEPVLLGFNNQDLGRLGFISTPLMSDIDEKAYNALRQAGVGHMDSRAIAFAVRSQCDYFVSFDTNDVIPNKLAIEAICPPMRILTPTECIAELAAIGIV